ncbi:putative peptidase [Sedimentisphaera cyanobacteriorum]|uniref:Putative peptidase n=1 Tax=Sedimentisphaera cyanobacteriorum TaxID=1940790 RepID=A0A1Q2HPG4_9BACT|nr:Xaa-Pro peptidase family protein [Sedimentisphaera cyanobacteriorum]AQQ09123.1 putative peptidase [Sedimentisphaera cyanobacteriorum]
MEELFQQRVKSARKNIKEQNCQAGLFTSWANVNYLTGFRGDDSWVMVSPRQVFLLTDSRYTEQAERECFGCKIVSRKGSMIEAVGSLIKRYKSVNNIAVQRDMPYGASQDIEYKFGVQLHPIESVVSSVRAIKDEAEIANIRKAVNISGKVLKFALAELKPGITESEFAGLIEYQMRKHSAGRAFTTIACFGAGGSEPHHIPGKRKLRKNDYVLIDYGASWKGYCSDITRSFAVGRAGEEYRRAYETVKLAQKAAIDMIAPGVKMADADKAARKVIKDSGFDVYGHGTGHGFGLDIHEQPRLSGKSLDIFTPGHVITVEPGIYLSGKFGIRLEDDILVTENGREILSRGEKSPELEIVKF